MVRLNGDGENETKSLGNRSYLLRKHNSAYIIQLTSKSNYILVSVREVNNSSCYSSKRTLEQLKTYTLFNTTNMSLLKAIELIENCILNDRVEIQQQDNAIDLFLISDNYTLTIPLQKEEARLFEEMVHTNKYSCRRLVINLLEIGVCLHMLVIICIYLKSYISNAAEFKYNGGNYNEALDILNLEKDYRNINTLYLKGLCLFRLEKYLEAMKFMKQVELMDKDYKELGLYLILCKSSIQQQAIKELYLGADLLKSKFYELAIVSFNKSLAYEPCAEAYYNKGIALLYLGETDDATEAMNKALEIDPTHSYARQLTIAILNYLPTMVSIRIPPQIIDYMIDVTYKLK
jgi:tetratricopeptide (TPR) repeat protein